MVLVYEDLLTAFEGDELLSEFFPCEEIENGALWEVEVEGAVDVDIGANPYAEGGEGDDEGVDDQAIKLVDIVDKFRLQEQPPFDKKSFVVYLKKCIKLLLAKLEGDKQDQFKKTNEEATKTLLCKIKRLQTFVVESMQEDGNLVFVYFKDDVDTTVLYLCA